MAPSSANIKAAQAVIASRQRFQKSLTRGTSSTKQPLSLREAAARYPGATRASIDRIVKRLEAANTLNYSEVTEARRACCRPATLAATIPGIPTTDIMGEIGGLLEDLDDPRRLRSLLLGRDSERLRRSIFSLERAMASLRAVMRPPPLELLKRLLTFFLVESEDQRNTPLNTVETSDNKGIAAKEDNDDLSSCHDDHHEHEEMVAVKTLQDVELVIDTSTVDELEDLHKDEDVEDERSHNSLLVTQDRIATKPQNETHDELVDGLTDDHLPHGDGDERSSDTNSGDVDGKLELEELLDRVVNSTTPAESNNDRREVIIHEDNIGGFLGDFGSSNTHRETNISSLESRGIVSTITSDSDNLTQRSQGLDENTLILGTGAGENTELLDNSNTVCFAELAEILTLHDGVGLIDSLLGKDTTVEGNGAGSFDVVTCNHLDVDRGNSTVLHSLGDTLADRILDTDDTHPCKVVNEVGKIDFLVGFILGSESKNRRPGFEVAVGEADGSEGVGSVREDDGTKLFLVAVGEGFSSMALCGIAEDGVAFAEDNFGSTLDEKTVLGLILCRTGDLDDGTHTLSLGVEWEELRDGVVGSFDGERAESEIATSPVEKSSFGLCADESHLAVFLGLESGGVDSDGSLDKLVVFGVQLGGELAKSDGLTLLAGHDVLGKGSSLVGADDSGVSHGFARLQVSHQVVLACHLLGGKGERECDSERKTFRDGDDDDGDGGDEDLEEGLALLFAAFVVVGKTSEELNEENEEEKTTCCATEFGNVACEELLQLWRLLVEKSVEDLFSRDLLDEIRLSSGGRLITAEVVARDKDTIHRDDIARLEEHNISDEDIVDGDVLRLSGAS
ncbi:hypothetical protein HG530_005620 [Fusarium avenaceum]|nr:hypothetical protein HG530_005620 [Fusarium avenaceum]